MKDQKFASRIYIIGLPSSGKTTFGKILAQYVNYKFVDTDALIVQKEQRSIPQVFTESGENYFRKVEQTVLDETKVLEQTVIATGGGMPCFFDNMTKINQFGVSIFINVLPETIAQRITKNDASRPLLKTHNQEDILPQIQKKYEARKGFYQQAQIILDEHEVEPEILLERLKKLAIA